MQSMLFPNLLCTVKHLVIVIVVFVLAYPLAVKQSIQNVDTQKSYPAFRNGDDFECKHCESSFYIRKSFGHKLKQKTLKLTVLFWHLIYTSMHANPHTSCNLLHIKSVTTWLISLKKRKQTVISKLCKWILYEGKRLQLITGSWKITSFSDGNIQLC